MVFKQLFNYFPTETGIEGVQKKKSCSEKIINIYRKTPFLESLSNEVADLRPAIVLKKLQHRCFPVNFAKF